jgi:multiple sugar transport system permease protein
MTRENIKKMRKASVRNNLSKIGIYTALSIVALCILAPLYVVIITSFKTKAEAMDPSFTFWPKEFDVHGYIEVFTYTSGGGDELPTVVRGFINTMIICIPTSIVGTLVSALAAFAFSKLKYKSKNFLFTTLLVTMMIPGTISMIPSYILFDQINWVDSFLPLIVPAMLGSASCVFFMRQFFYSIPNELMESSEIDGLGNFGIFVRVILPLSVPALIAQFLLSFVGTYNAYLGPLIYLQSPENYTLQIALNFFRGTYQTDWAVVMAGAAVSLLPTLLLFLIGQKYFIDGIATTGIKM